MKFIRDIISERRGVAPTIAPVVPPARDEDRLQTPDQTPVMADLTASLPIPAEPAPQLAPHLAPQPAPLMEADADMDFVANFFPESEDDRDAAPDLPLLAADWEDDTPDTGLGQDAGLAPPEAWTDQEFRTVRVADAESPIAWTAPAAPLSREPRSGAVRPVSLFDGVKAAEPTARPRPITDLLLQQMRAQEARQHAARAAEAKVDAAPMALAPSPELAPELPPELPPAETRPPLQSLNEMPFVSVERAAAPAAAAPPPAFEVPPPATGRGANRSGRVKTRLLGFDPESLGMASPFEKPEARANDPFPVGWLVVVAGPGRGAAFALHDGVSRVGRGEDQTVCLNFGDNSISRENHVSIAYDAEQSAFYIGQSGRTNIVRLNNKPLLSTEQIRSGDQIRVGETTLRLAALCGEDFSWTAKA